MIGRRDALRAMAMAPALAAAPPQSILRTPIGEFVNALEFEKEAKLRLPPAIFSMIAGGDRSDFDRCTFRPRMMSETSKLSLETELFGERMFAPILTGPASDQTRFHPEGILAMARGAKTAKALAIVSSGSGHPLEKIAAESGSFWFQVTNSGQERDAARRAIGLGAKALVVTVRPGAPVDWQGIGKLPAGVPVLLKGVMNAAVAEAAMRNGIRGIVVSNYRGAASPSPFAALPAIHAAVAGRAPVLIDGGFRRGTDILKALILGAGAVLVTRPVLWGLAAYGAEGVQTVLELLQSELARNMIMIGAITPKALTKDMIRIHGR